MTNVHDLVEVETKGTPFVEESLLLGGLGDKTLLSGEKVDRISLGALLSGLQTRNQDFTLKSRPLIWLRTGGSI